MSLNELNEFLRKEAVKMTEKAMTDSFAYEKIERAFNDLIAGCENWKMSHSIFIGDEDLGKVGVQAILFAAACIFFTGGCEITAYDTNTIEVSTKGYYHYIGA